LTLRAPEPFSKFNSDPLDVGARSESAHSSHNLHSGYVAVPVTEEPGPDNLNGFPLQQTLRQRHTIRPQREIGLTAHLRRVIIAPMASPSRYAGIPGFDVGTDDAPTPSTPPPERSLVENHELVTDLARYSETLCSESAIRKKWRLSEDTWKMLGSSDELVRAIEEEKTRRIRSGATKRELAQQHIIRGPGVLASIMDDPQANARHRVDSIKTLNAIADPGPEAAVGEERIIIKIDMGADLRAKGQEPNPGDVVIIEAAARPSTPKQIENDHSEQSDDEWRR